MSLINMGHYWHMLQGLGPAAKSNVLALSGKPIQNLPVVEMQFMKIALQGGAEIIPI